MIPRSSYLSINTALHRSATSLSILFFLCALSAAQTPEGPLVLQRGQDSTDFGNAQANRGKTGPIDWTRDEKTGRIQVTLEKDSRYIDGAFLGRGPDGSDYFTFASAYYRLSLPGTHGPQKQSGTSGVGSTLGRLTGPWGAGVAAARAAQARQNANAGQPNFEFTEIHKSDVPPGRFLSLGDASPSGRASASSLPILTEIKDGKGAVRGYTLQLPNQDTAMVVTKQPCFGNDAYALPEMPSVIYVLTRDAKTNTISGLKQITNVSGKDPCDSAPAVTQTATSAAAAAPSDPPKPDYTLTQIDGDQFHLVYADKDGKKDLIVTKLKDKLFCSTTSGKTYLIEPDERLTVLDSSYAMALKCSIKATQQYQQPQR